jgi:hypothetical protein
VNPFHDEGISLSRFARLLALGVLALAGLLSLGVRGVVLVQSSIFPASRPAVREPTVSSGTERQRPQHRSPDFGSVSKSRLPARGKGGSVDSTDPTHARPGRGDATLPAVHQQDGLTPGDS